MRRDGTCILFKPHSVVSKHFQIWAGSGTYLRIREQLSWNSELDEMKFAFRTWKLTANCVKDLNHSFLFRYITCYEHPLSSWNWPLNEQEVVYYVQMYINKWNVSCPLNSEWVHWRAGCWLVLWTLSHVGGTFFWGSIPFWCWAAPTEVWQGTILLSQC